MGKLGVASRDSGAELPAYGERPSVSVGRAGPPCPAADLAGRVQGSPATRDVTATVGWTLPWQVGAVVPRSAAKCDMSVFDLQSRRWYAQDIGREG